MEYYINLISKRTHGSNLVSKTRVHSHIQPTEEQFEEWKKGTIESFIVGTHHHPMVIELEKEKFGEEVQKFYRKIGKKAEQQDDSTVFKIPSKQGSFYEEIDHLWLYSPDYKSNIAVIKIK